MQRGKVRGTVERLLVHITTFVDLNHEGVVILCFGERFAIGEGVVDTNRIAAIDKICDNPIEKRPSRSGIIFIPTDTDIYIRRARTKRRGMRGKRMTINK